ncbi:MAG: ATP-dependent DNA helicase RecG, partial [Spirochaetaceae bacterium]|nr:ATP-dependent DNA helicase RecG [Spirochaetaceae bacterium]
DNLIDRLRKVLPFELTPDQNSSLDDIRQDLASGRPMSRLLQGEVGSGKTLIAFMAALGVIAVGRQAAFMAPTELLARQHADNAARLLEPLGVKVAFLTGDVTGSSRSALTTALGAGEVDLAVGTHALFGSDVGFMDLGLVVIDEQHRFGVDQRRSLTEKGRAVDVLALSATPIPRTLALTAFGDMDVSSIRTMPAGRLPVETHLARMGNESKVYDFVRRELGAGNRAYFVYPLIEESEKSDLKDAENMFARLSAGIFPEFKAALIHSRVDEEDKRRIMTDFREGRLNLLIATSVVEVGVDIPEATCMVIEHAERFGLSALHQLRGRVGRGKEQSYCFLVYAEPLTDDGKKRMMIMKETHDGFVLAEEDLKMRGPGDMAGTRQSGFLRLSIADPVRDMNVLLDAREKAQGIMAKDPGLLGAGMTDLRELFANCPPFDKNLLSTG